MRTATLNSQLSYRPNGWPKREFYSHNGQMDGRYENLRDKTIIPAKMDGRYERYQSTDGWLVVKNCKNGLHTKLLNVSPNC